MPVKPYTALPWHIGMKPGPMIYGLDGEQVADCRGLLDTRESCLNTTYILNACNAYPSMLSLLRRAADSLHEYCSDVNGDMNDSLGTEIENYLEQHK